MPRLLCRTRDLAALSGLGGEHDRLAHIVEPAGVTDVCARRAAVAERAGGAVKAELVCERERPLGEADCRPQVAPCSISARATSVSASTSAGPGGSGSKQRQCLGGELAQRGSAKLESTPLSRCMAWAGAARSPARGGR